MIYIYNLFNVDEPDTSDVSFPSPDVLEQMFPDSCIVRRTLFSDSNRSMIINKYSDDYVTYFSEVGDGRKKCRIDLCTCMDEFFSEMTEPMLKKYRVENGSYIYSVNIVCDVEKINGTFAKEIKEEDICLEQNRFVSIKGRGRSPEPKISRRERKKLEQKNKQFQEGLEKIFENCQDAIE